MKKICLFAFILISLTAFAYAADSATEPWRWINLSDWHGAEKYTQVWEKSTKNPKGRGWGQKGYESLEAYLSAMRDADIATLARIKRDYGGELLVIPGDTNSGHWDSPAFRASLRSVYPGLSNEAVVRKAAHLCFGAMRNAFAEAGYPLMLVALGDHEIGDNPWKSNAAVTPLVPEFRAGFADVFNEEPCVDPADPGNPRRWTYSANATSSKRLFTNPIGAVPSRPLGTAYEETSYAWQYKNVLFVTVDVFRQDDFVTRLGEEGTIMGDCEGPHVQWFKKVLAAAKSISSIKHIIVQSHLPVIYPVRKYASSGMMMEGTIDSPFLQAMREGKVDLYLAGEVHSNTITLDPDSDLVQWVCRGNGATNFSAVDISDSKIVIQTWKNKEAGESETDILLGSVVIEKSPGAGSVITSKGFLKAINPKGLNVHYTFDSLRPEGDILTAVAGPNVNNTPCDKAFENSGEFSNDYTAWTKNTSVGEGLIGGCVKMWAGKSVLGLSSMGPISHSHPRTVGLWIRTVSAKRQILLNTTSFWGKDRDFFNLSLNDGKFEVLLAEDKMKRAEGSALNDGSWHHVAATVPSQGSTLDDVQLYIDGVLQVKVKTTKGASLVNTAQSNWMGIGILLAGSAYKLDRKLAMADYEGELDDFALWTRPLSGAQIRALVQGAKTQGYNAAEMEQLFALQEAQSGKVTIGDDAWTYERNADGAPGAFEKKANTLTLDLGAPGALVCQSKQGAALPFEKRESFLDLKVPGGGPFE